MRLQLCVLCCVAAVVACEQRPPSSAPSDAGPGGGGEVDIETDSAQPGQPCRVDSDCDGGFDVECLRGSCFPTVYAGCLDDRFALSGARDELSDSRTVDCAVWGGRCERFRGCVLPAGECVRDSFCGSEAGSWSCPADRVCGVPPDLVSTPAFPLAVSLPVDLSFEDNGNGWCIVLDISSPTAILFSEVVDALTLRQGPFDGVGPFSPGLQTGTGPLTICNPIGGGRIRLEEVAWDDPRLGEICIDDHHMRRSTGDVACPDDSVCEMRLGAVPVCRRATGPCAGNGCLGTCVEDDGDRSCSPIVVDPSTDRRCLGNLFQVQQPVVDPLLIVCSERCEEFIGCVVGPGGSCRADEQCVSPEDGDALGPCPSSGTCPG